VYFGDNYIDVANGDSSTYQGNFLQPQNSCAPGTLKEGEIYYWRVDAISGTTVQGETWTFTTTSAVCIKVDLAEVECPDASIIRPQTAKPGWWYWATGRWADLYMHDCSWACEQFPCPGGIDGTGIEAALTMINEGTGGLKVCGLTMRSLAGGGCPYPEVGFGGPDAGKYYDSFDPKPGPICNTWFQEVDWPEEQRGAIVLALHNLPAGTYALYGYHNMFSQYRWYETAGGTWVPNDGSDIDPPMPLIRAYSVKEYRYLPYASTDAFQKSTKTNWATGPFAEGVISVQDACDVPIQNVLSDDELNPSEIQFVTDGSPVIVIYNAGSGHVDRLAREQGGDT